MYWKKSTSLWAAMLCALGLCNWSTSAAHASCTEGIAEVIGQMPDLIFLTSRSSTVYSLDFKFTAIVPTKGAELFYGNCGIFLHSNIPGVGLAANTRDSGHGGLQFGEVILRSPGLEIASSVAPGELGTLGGHVTSFDVGVTEQSLASVTKLPQYDVIEIYSWGKEFCSLTPWSDFLSSCKAQRIGVMNVYIMDPDDKFPLTFTVTAAPANTDCFAFQPRSFGSTAGIDLCRNSVWFDNAFTNGNPSARLLVTQNWNPNGQAHHYNPHNIGVAYDGRRWRIFNQDDASILGASFNVRIEGNAPPVLGNASSGDKVYIDDPAANFNPNAVVFVTPNFNSQRGRFGVFGFRNPHPIGVDYDTQRGRWFIFNKTSRLLPPMPRSMSRYMEHRTYLVLAPAFPWCRTRHDRNRKTPCRLIGRLATAHHRPTSLSLIMQASQTTTRIQPVFGMMARTGMSSMKISGA